MNATTVVKQLVKRTLLTLFVLSVAIRASDIPLQTAQNKKVHIAVKGQVCRMLPVALVAGFSIPFEIGAVGVELGTVVWTFGAAVAGVIGLWFSKKKDEPIEIKPLGPDNDSNDPEDPHRKKRVTEKIANMAQYFMQHAVGKKVKDCFRKIKERYHGQSMYEAIKNVPGTTIKKGDKLYLDAQHHNHFEHFSANREPIDVLNLDLTQNTAKTIAAQSRKLPRF